MNVSNPYSFNLSVGEVTPDIFNVRSNVAKEIIRITPTGEIYWHGKLVETNEDFKTSMLELAEYFKGRKP
jgi:hypothetical protein